MEPIEVSYQDILKLRRAKNSQIAYIDKSGLDKWRLILNNLQYVFFCDIDKSTESGSDGKDFVDNRQAYFNKPILEMPDTVETHDFADNSTWMFGTSNSLCLIRPTTRQVISLRENKVIFDKDLDFDGETVSMVLWMGDNAPCPDFDETNKTPTAFGSPAWNPGVSAGWVTKDQLQDAIGYTKQYHLSSQEVTHHIYLDPYGVIQYLAVVHVFSSILEIKAKSKHQINGNVIEAFFPYVRPINIRNSYKERIEIYTSNNTEFVSPNNEQGKAVLFTELTNEF